GAAFKRQTPADRFGVASVTDQISDVINGLDDIATRLAHAIDKLHAMPAQIADLNVTVTDDEQAEKIQRLNAQLGTCRQISENQVTRLNNQFYELQRLNEKVGDLNAQLAKERKMSTDKSASISKLIRDRDALAAVQRNHADAWRRIDHRDRKIAELERVIEASDNGVIAQGET